jgi:hypothetical protein
LCKWFTAICPEGKLATWPLVTEKAKSLNDDMKIDDKCTFSKSSDKKLPVRI